MKYGFFVIRIPPLRLRFSFSVKTDKKDLHVKINLQSTITKLTGGL